MALNPENVRNARIVIEKELYYTEEWLSNEIDFTTPSARYYTDKRVAYQTAIAALNLCDRKHLRELIEELRGKYNDVEHKLGDVSDIYEEAITDVLVALGLKGDKI